MAESYICNDCNECFNHKDQIITHIKIHENAINNIKYEDQYQCKHCHSRFDTVMFLKMHEKYHHQQNIFIRKDATSKSWKVDTTNNGEYEDSIEKEYDAKLSKPITEFQQDKISNKKETNNKCTEIKTDSLNSDLEEKASGCHNTAPNAIFRGEDGKLNCHICGKTFTRAGNLKIHLTTIHTDIKPFHCTVCNKQFSQLGSLKSHLNVHIGDRSYLCSLCDKSFTCSSSLRIHMRVHTGERPYTCSICEKSFYDSSTLTKHNRTHTGERPYHCDLCKKSFVNSQSLKKHILIHTGERRFKCDICHKKFSSLGNLQTHIRMHTGEKPYSCDICQKKFARLENVNNHKRRHTGEKPYSCSICSKAFVQSGNFKRHMKMHSRKNHTVTIEIDTRNEISSE